MPTLSVHLSQETLDGLEKAIEEDGGQLEDLVEGILSHWVKEREGYASFREHQKRGDPERGLAILDKLNKAQGRKPFDLDK